MKLVRGLDNLRGRIGSCVAAIGNFDGVHLGHREMIRVLQAHGRRLGLPVVVVSFEPSPREYFARGPVPARLTKFREKFDALAALGIDWFVCLRFDARMAGVGADTFITDILVRGIGLKFIVVGHDFRFARGREGSVATLQEKGAALGFGVEEIPPFQVDGERVSSSLVRAALEAGNLYRAQLLLGRPFRLSGKVGPGQRLGRLLGFPTANLCLHRQVTPLHGIFAVRVSGAGLDNRPGVASLGTRPVLNVAGIETPTPLLEVHVFDFDGDLYRRHLHVDFIARLREERWFPNLEALTVQMREDARQAREILEADSG